MTDRQGPNITALIVGISGIATVGLLAAGATVLALHIAGWVQEMRACADAGAEACTVEAME